MFKCNFSCIRTQKYCIKAGLNEEQISTSIDSNSPYVMKQIVTLEMETSTLTAAERKGMPMAVGKTR